MLGQMVEITIIEKGKATITRGKLIHIGQMPYNDNSTCPVYILECEDTIEQIPGKKQFGAVEINRVKEAPLQSIESRYISLLQHLGVNGHDGAISEIISLRKSAGLT